MLYVLVLVIINERKSLGYLSLIEPLQSIHQSHSMARSDWLCIVSVVWYIVPYWVGHRLTKGGVPPFRVTPPCTAPLYNYIHFP